MTLTVKEKEHWKERIALKIEQRIKTLVNDKQPDYLKKVAEQAQEKAIERLGLTNNQRRQADIERKIALLNSENEQLKQTALAAVGGLAEEGDRSAYPWRIQARFEAGLKTMTETQERLIMSGDELGREVLKLRSEQEQLLDTIWLATSTKQIRELWQSVSELIGEEPTKLRASALTLEPTKE